MTILFCQNRNGFLEIETLVLSIHYRHGSWELFAKGIGTNLLQDQLQELAAEAPPDSQGFKGSRCSSLPSLPAPAVLLAGELGVTHGRGAGWLQWWTCDVAYAVCCTRTTGNVPHPRLTERSFLFYCVTRPHREHPFCSLLVSPAQLYKTLACLYPLTGKASVKWCATASRHF